jgi:hypothetical protein
VGGGHPRLWTGGGGAELEEAARVTMDGGARGGQRGGMGPMGSAREHGTGEKAGRRWGWAGVEAREGTEERAL